MFEKIVVRSQLSQTEGFDLGMLAETLLFYQHCHLILDHGSFGVLLDKIGIENMLRLIEEEHVTTTFLLDTSGAHTQDFGFALHSFVNFELVGHEERKFKNFEERITHQLDHKFGAKKEHKLLARKFVRHLTRKRISDFKIGMHDSLRLAKADLDNQEFLEKAVSDVLRSQIPDTFLPRKIKFTSIKFENGHVIDTNIDFETINKFLEGETGSADHNLSTAQLLSTILRAREDLIFAVNYSSEFITRPSVAALINLHFTSLLERREKSKDQITVFNELVLGDGYALREIMNSEQKTFKEFLGLLDQARRFKEHIGKINPDEELVKSYLKSLVKDSWIDTRPGKTLRWGFWSSLGVVSELLVPSAGINLGISTAVGAVDTFVLDKLIKGWRPSYFVDDHLKNFVRKSNS